MQALPLGDLSATPWSLSPLWFALVAVLVPALVWLALAWRRALLECPNRVRRAGVKEMRKLVKTMQRAQVAPRPAHLHAWLRVSARVWDVRTSAPSVVEVTRAAQSLSGDEAVSTEWRELWLSAEYCLYAPKAQVTPDWVNRASAASASVEMPKRERMFPDRLSDWLPTSAATGARIGGRRPLFLVRLGRAALSVGVAALIVTAVAPPPADADVPWSAPTETAEMSSSDSEADTIESSAENAEEVTIAEPLPPEVGEAAQAALAANWNDWAAHHNLAAYQTQEGDLPQAIAHATAAFAQHPAASTTRSTLLAALGDTQSVDPTLRRLTSGTWYERAPALLPAATWQRLALLGGLMAAAGLSAMILAMYTKPVRQSESSRRTAQLRAPSNGRMSRLLDMPLVGVGRVAFVGGALILAIATSSWNAYGAFNQPAAAILVQNANMTPVPTDLVPTEETSPVSAGTVVVMRRSFLGWREISKSPEATGWIRGNAVMPLYAGG